MQSTSMSWYSRAVRHWLPDIAVLRPIGDGYRLQVSLKRHVGLLRASTRVREYAIALRLASLTGPCGVLYDIGANVGLYTIGFAANRTRIVHSFEPSELVLPYLRRNVSMNRLEKVQVHPVLLSDAQGTRRFVLDQMTTAQSHVGDSSEQGGVSMPCVDLDSYVREHSLPAPDLVKIDVEGHDLPVLHGMEHVLSAKPIIYLEGGMRTEDGRIGAISLLLSHGYSVRNLEGTAVLSPDTREYAFLAIPET